VPSDATAFANRDATHDINIVGSWLPDDAGADRHVAWVRQMFEALQPFSKGVYVNFTSDDANDRVQAAYSPAQWQRLVTLKNKDKPGQLVRVPPHNPHT